MPNALSGLSTAVSTVGNVGSAIGGIVLVSPQHTIGYQPLIESFGLSFKPKPLLFHYEAENSVALKSDITDHYVESNYAIQDHISLPPESITVRGFIGELNDVLEGPFAEPLQILKDKLVAISAYTPGLSISAQNTFNTAFQAYQAAQSILKSAVSSYESLSGQGGLNVIGEGGIETQFKNQSKQQTMFQQFYGYWRSRTLFNVQTPWAVFNNCAIQSLTANQGADTTEITDFEITFKVMRFTSTQTTIFKKSGRANSQSTALVDLGTSSLTLA